MHQCLSSVPPFRELVAIISLWRIPSRSARRKGKKRWRQKRQEVISGRASLHTRCPPQAGGVITSTGIRRPGTTTYQHLPSTQRNETPVDHDYVRTSAAESSPEKPFPCPVSGCRNRYKFLSGRANHMVNEHQIDPPVPPNWTDFKCTVCYKAFMTERELQEHRAEHQNSAMISPQYCMQPQTSQTGSDRTQAIRSCLQPKKPPSPGSGTQARGSCMQPQTSQSSSDGTQAIRHGMRPKTRQSFSDWTQAIRFGMRPQTPQSASALTQAVRYPSHPQTPQSPSKEIH